MSEMIKKVADAICERRNANDWPCNGLDFDTEMARAAIEAMREPTKEMIDHGNNLCISHSWSSRGEHTEDADYIYDQMINKALEE